MGRFVSFAIFLSVAVAILGGLHYYIWARLVRDPQLPGPWATGALAALIVFGAGFPAMVLLTRKFPFAARFLGWPLYTWLGITFFLFILLLGADLAQALHRVWQRIASSGQP